jgi:hypothetical protein
MIKRRIHTGQNHPCSSNGKVDATNFKIYSFQYNFYETMYASSVNKEGINFVVSFKEASITLLQLARKRSIPVVIRAGFLTLMQLTSMHY